ncbi:hypothetical protein CK203_093293 [Vitis vinifera]|uniref:Retrovirus-related Pol polyprotein from transposon RE1 n=1 Tax=Vitis vinifera TaxID=29760 RepID=A0A438E2U4_VITVI|nr:hypothetical protein CK203_093293 [Vitis vinifera]
MVSKHHSNEIMAEPKPNTPALSASSPPSISNLFENTHSLNSIDIKSQVDELVMMDAPIRSEDLTIKILKRTYCKYKDIASAVRGRETPISFEELHEKLLNFEAHLQHEEEKKNNLPVTTNYANKMGNGDRNNNLN